MTRNYNARWRKWMPYLELHINLHPLFSVTTHLMRDAFERDIFEYIRFDLSILKRKVFHFNLWRKRV